MSTEIETLTVTGEQLHALFDILSHVETYSEVENFKHADGAANFGYPFTKGSAAKPSSLSSQEAPAPNPPAQEEPVASFTSFLLRRRATAPAAPPAPPATPPTKSNGSAKKSKKKGSDASASPVLQTLLARAALPLPGIKDLPRDFWSVRVQGILTRLGAADLSESYDKGALGTRKTLATGSSAVLEMLGRGAVGGLKRRRTNATSAPEEEINGGEKKYRLDNAEDLTRAWDDLAEDGVYGNLVDGLFAHFAETPDMDAYSTTIRAAVEYTIIHLATLIHYVFIQSPEGEYILKMLNNVNNLVPYAMIKQTLRIGNAATMINGMMRLLLAKLSITSMTNWVGLTANEDDGMNLVQRIMSLVLLWDSNEFKKIAERVEKDKDGPNPEILAAIKQHVLDAEAHDAVRVVSLENAESIVVAIIKATNPALLKDLSDEQHTSCLEYYSALLSVRDREKITDTFCRQPPDLFTTAVKDVVAAYDPIIRTVHDRVDLRHHVESLQRFIEDFFRVSIPKGTEDGHRKTVSIEDYIKLLQRHRAQLHDFLHAIAKDCPDVWDEFRTYSNEAVQRYRQPMATTNGKTQSVMDHELTAMVQALDNSTQQAVISQVNAHVNYLSTIKTISDARLQFIAARNSLPEDSEETITTSGPGIYLSRWQSLLDETLITPDQKTTALRHGSDVRHATTMGKIGVVGNEAGEKERKLDFGPPAPDVSTVVNTLRKQYKKVAQKVAIAETTLTT